ncbi:response regulator [Pelagicoccus sp. SDUM812002]|uniref:response regulator n=1 Tax=Pelagicoccus sp. SDUM812002 TaxID=3041266 RepID=UPI00280EF036|nr:response regulator [Pelagicoccus sp. SDUM812002]MDQ8188325.1 response regulator [Pelagicoccus sp. SDUM812002]
MQNGSLPTGASETPLRSEGEASPRVLIVEDTESNLLIAKAILKKCGAVHLDTAANGLVALDLLKRNHYDIVYMDCMMPEMDGYEATRKIRGGTTGVENMTVPIIALTANAILGDREECLKAGMSDYLSKPLRPTLLCASLKHWAGSRHS